MASSNPTMNEAIYRQVGRADAATRGMTLGGTVAKTGILLVLLLMAATFTWTQAAHGGENLSYGLLMAGAIGGLVVAFITVFRPQASPFTGPVYAILEGLVLGAISAVTEARYPGIAIQAVGLCVAVLAIMLFLYGTGLVRATEKFKIGVIAATGAIFLVYVADFILSLFHFPLAMIHQGGMIGIGFSLVVVVVAALNLILDFDFIDKGVQQQAPRYMEWYGGFSLMVTLVWMYLEMLRLLSKLRGRD